MMAVSTYYQTPSVGYAVTVRDSVVRSNLSQLGSKYIPAPHTRLLIVVSHKSGIGTVLFRGNPSIYMHNHLKKMEILMLFSIFPILLYDIYVTRY
jgi:hypothetical protein